MPAEGFVTEESGPSRNRSYLLWVLPVAFLVGISLWLALSSAGSSSKDWAFPALVLGLAGIAAGSLLGYPRRPRQLSLAVLALFALYALWVAAANLWTADIGRAWPATGRTFLYLLVAALAFAYFTSPYARAAFKYLVMASCLVMLIAVLWRLWPASSLDGLFAGNRLVYPTGDADSAAALFLLPFWPLMWLASGPRERAPIRGISLGLATGLVGLAVLTQSQAAAWSLGITLLLMFALSPARLRLLFHLVVPGLLMVYAFPILNGYWLQDPAVLSGAVGARTLTVAALAGGFIGMIVALLEGWVKVTARMKAIFGAVVVLGCIAGIVYGAMVFTTAAGGAVTWFENAWSRLAAEPAGDRPSIAAGAGGVSSSSRTEVWSAAWQRFEGSLLVGSGADAGAASAPAGDGATTGQASNSPAAPQAAPLLLQVLGDTGVVGGILLFGAFLLSATGILWPRTMAGWRRARGKATPARGHDRWGADAVLYGWQMSLLVGLASWFVLANMEPLWRTPGLVVPAVLMLGAALARTDSRAGTLWPAVRRRLRRKRSTAWTDGRTTATSRPKPFKRFLYGNLRPEGPLSQAFRVMLLVLSAAVIILATCVYFLASV